QLGFPEVIKLQKDGSVRPGGDLADVFFLKFREALDRDFLRWVKKADRNRNVPLGPFRCLKMNPNQNRRFFCRSHPKNHPCQSC
ncbi:MAG: hypothetical protein EBU36_06585, partial [Verrucomicrobia bacterium]|nr:hypothetical protein [Verrucomicrobiota bacterium]